MDVTEYTPTREEYAYTFGGAPPAMRVKPGAALRLWSDDAYGGAFDARVRYLLEVVRDVREVWPTDRVLAVRVSSTDWVEGGWSVDDTVALAGLLQREGIDLLDCSSGGSVPTAVVPNTPGYQVGFAAEVKRETGLPTAAVVPPELAADAAAALVSGRVDAVDLEDPS